MSKLSQDMRFGRYFCLGGPNDPIFNFFVAFFEEKKARVTSWKRNMDFANMINTGKNSGNKLLSGL